MEWCQEGEETYGVDELGTSVAARSGSASAQLGERVLGSEGVT